MIFLLDTPNETTTGFGVLLWVVGVLAPLAAVTIGKLYFDGKNKDKLITKLQKEHADELKSINEKQREQEKESLGVLNSLTAVLNELGRGVDREIPAKIKDTQDLVEKKSNEIKEHITLYQRGPQQ